MRFLRLAHQQNGFAKKYGCWHAFTNLHQPLTLCFRLRASALWPPAVSRFKSTRRRFQFSVSWCSKASAWGHASRFFLALSDIYLVDDTDCIKPTHSTLLLLDLETIFFSGPPLDLPVFHLQDQWSRKRILMMQTAVIPNSEKRACDGMSSLKAKRLRRVDMEILSDPKVTVVFIPSRSRNALWVFRAGESDRATTSLEPLDFGVVA